MATLIGGMIAESYGLPGSGTDFSGDDTLLGRGGDDFFFASTGNDIISGGSGYDRVYYENDGYATGGVIINTRAYTVGSTSGGTVDKADGSTDRIDGIELYFLTGGNDSAYLPGYTSYVWDGAGDDYISISGGAAGDPGVYLDVGAGSDTYYAGGSDSDTISFLDTGGAGGVTLTMSGSSYGSGYDTLGGFDQFHYFETFVLTGQADSFTGSTGAVTVRGLGGDDTLTGGSADDTLEGGDGQDTLRGGDGDDTIEGGADYDDIEGGAGADIVDGGDGSDIVFGNDGNDIVRGGAGNDDVFGDLGDDRLEGGAGNDALTGGGGADVFVIAPGAGSDFILDFENGIDVIDATAFGLSPAEARAQRSAITSTVVGIEIDLEPLGGAPGEVLTVDGLLLGQVSVDDFIL